MNRGFLTLAAALLPLAALAQTYKWKDEAGRLHFTQVPPRTGVYEIIGPARAPGSAPNQEALNESLEQSVEAEPERKKTEGMAALQQARRQEACRQAIEQLAYLDARTARHLATADEKGGYARMTEEEFQRQRAAQEAAIKQNCD